MIETYMSHNKIKELFSKHPILYSTGLFMLYTICFFITEKINSRPAFLIHSFIDDLIPFSSYAAIPYCFWFIEIAVVLLYVYRSKGNDELFRSVSLILSAMITATVLYFLFPTQIDLRSANVPGNDLCALLTRFIYTVDNSRNVCPSGHAYVCYLMSVIWKRNADKKTALFMAVLNIVISVSTLFLKQHSIIDILIGLIYGILIRYISDRMYDRN